MKKSGPKSLSEAISQLENASHSTAEDFKHVLEKDYSEVQKALQTLKPYLNDFQDSLESEVKKRTSQAEVKVRENPWLAIGIVGLFALVIGLFLGTRRSSHKDEES